MNLHKALAALTGLLHAAATSAQWTKTPIWEAPGTYASTLDDPSCTTVDAGHWDSDVPRMYTALISTFANYSRSIYGVCARTMTSSNDGMAYPECMLQYEEHCDFSSLVPDSLRSEYAAYTNSASTWWETHSSRIFEVSEECPYAWIMAMALSDAGPSWFRLAAMYGECAMAKTTGETASVTPAPTAQPGADTGAEATPEPTQDSAASRVSIGWGVAALVAAFI
ncbi:hypothetical protein B0T11DRAFT_331030 [Plectosphaerella cucumerina]|uniref:DUF7735 domain-containing protein n=1 Tax=Plectosphaerella cucumerina TaxID=40658 RepID=A0A8K0TD13_9PEZI|nr:hypothetical protein B0T11DRAFT_331030 [Plectosphaerella cucumerina]